MQIHFPNTYKQFPFPTPRLPYNHRRLNRRRQKSIRCSLNPSSFESLFNNFISQIPSLQTNSFLTLAPALGLASGIALYLSKPKKLINNNNNSVNNLGEWVLFTSPTPFNRFVILRCPSICFEGSDLNERLVEEDRHFVRLSSGRIEVKERDLDERGLVYRRVCVGTEDGGVISIDWPGDLELDEERGLDTTVIIVPGTVEGSGESCVREFVLECLRRGCFPLVVNPRGCAGSPLTTARLFSAADSGDVSTAIEYIKKERPWSTMVATGWGYGANMLTKYLAEVGEQTPLTAATCINNPFDLEEATRCSPHHFAYDKLAKGLIGILQSNKELFQGKTNRFDVPRALSSTSIRDFEKAITMVSHGFNTLEEFYAKSSTVYAVRKVKIPTLFIQNDDGSVPVFSVPRHLIAENPFTSLLLCSSFPSSKLLTAKLTLPWCQDLAIEWLTAVELGLLKGRHPLVMDVDVTINPRKGFELLDNHVSGIKSGRGKKVVNFLASNASDEHSLDSTGTPIANIYPKSSPKEISQIQNNKANEDNNVGVHKAGPVDAVVVDEGVDSPEGNVLQTTQVVMNMLDATMPGTLTDEKKQKVLDAVGQGESLMTALQGAVPEDVREKLTSSVSGILKNKSSNIKLDQLLKLQDIPNMASGLRSNVQEKLKSPHAEGEKDENSSQMRSDDPLVVSQPTTGNHDLGDQSSNDLDKSTNTEQLHVNKSNGSDASTSEKDVGAVEDTDRGINDTEKGISDNVDSGSETGSKTESSSQSEGAGETRDPIEKDKVVLVDEKSESDIRDSNSDPQPEKNIADSSKDKEQPSVTTHIEEKTVPPTLSSEMPSDESHENKNDVDNLQASNNQNSSSSPAFSVSHALDALTGIDDSTQVAVSTVYNVIEDMITKLEDERDDKTEAHDEKSGEDGNSVSSSEEHLEKNNKKMEETSEHPDVAVDVSSSNKLACCEELTQEPVILDKCSNDTFQEVAMESYLDKEDGKSKPSVYQEPPEKSAVYINSTSNGSSLPVSAYGTPLYQGDMRSEIIPKISGSKPLDLASTSALFHEYSPEEGQLKLLEKTTIESPKDEYDDTIEPSYVILDAEEHKRDEQLKVDELHGNGSKGYTSSVRTIIMDAIFLEVGRRLNATYMQEMKSELSEDIVHVADAVCLALKDEETLPNMNVLDNASDESIILRGEHVTRAVSSALLETGILRKTLPVGVVVGSCLAALMKYPNVEVVDCSAETEEHSTSKAKSEKFNEIDDAVLEEAGQNEDLDKMDTKYESGVDANNSARNVAVVGAMSAALGASALLVNQQPLDDNQNASQDSISSGGMILEKNNGNLVTSLAEKAMSVAGPVVPTKDGEVDQDKLVAMMAELGQRGGILRLFGKVALLYGGIRGAMSLTDKLISFLRMAERPFYQRISGFICLVFVLWSPVVVPLLPSLVQSWTTHTSSKFTEISCVIGLYASIFILITSWGRQIRGYEKPLEQYGLDLNSSVKVQEFLKGLTGGVILVLLIQSLNFALGWVNLHWPTALPLSSSGALIWIKVYGKMVMLVMKGLATATGVSLVEELLFRSWLPDEIAADLGYYRGIIMSGLLFSLFQRSPLAIPGLWLLSLALTGAREKSKGHLWLPIGLRAGMLASSFIMQSGGYITYQPKFPLWVTGTPPLQPFSGVIGLAAALVLALFLYPRQQHQGRRLKRTIRD